MGLKKIQNIALLVFFFSLNFEVWEPFNTSNFSVSKLTGSLYFFTILPDLFYFVNYKNLKRFLIPLFIFFTLLTFISAIYINTLSSSFFNFSIFQNILLFIFLLNHSKKEPGILQKGMIAYALGSFVFSILFFIGIGIQDTGGGRIRMFGDNQNVIGIRMCISIIYSLYLVVQNPFQFGVKRFFFLLPLPFMMSLLLATGSRLGFISFTLCFVTGLLLLKTNKFYIKILVVAFGVVIGIYFWNQFLSSSLVYERLLKTAQTDDLSGRNDIWSSLLPLIKENPLLGVGTTGYDLYSQKVFGGFMSPHNVILEILCYTGLVGLLIYFWFFIRIFQTSYKKYRDSGSVIQLVLLIPILGNILSGQILLAKIAWVLYACCVSKTLLDGRIISKPYRITSNRMKVKSLNKIV